MAAAAPWTEWMCYVLSAAQMFRYGLHGGMKWLAALSDMVWTSEAMVLCWNKVASSIQVRTEQLQRVEEFSYLKVLLTSEGKKDCKIGCWLGTVARLMQADHSGNKRADSK